MKRFVPKALILATIALIAVTLFTQKALAVDYTVTPSNMGSWSIQKTGDASGTFVTGPATAPLGSGSARLFSGTNGSQEASLNTNAYNNIDLSNITTLQYAAYGANNIGGSVTEPYLFIDVMTSGGADSLRFDPNGQSVNSQLDTWQTWDAENGTWTSNLCPLTGTLPDYVNCIVARYGSGISITGLKFQLGPASQSDVLDGNVDNVTIGISHVETTYDFNPDGPGTVTATPTSTETSTPTATATATNTPLPATQTAIAGETATSAAATQTARAKTPISVGGSASEIDKSTLPDPNKIQSKGSISKRDKILGTLSGIGAVVIAGGALISRRRRS